MQKLKIEYTLLVFTVTVLLLTPLLWGIDFIHASESLLPDTGSTTCYDNEGDIISPCPQPLDQFYGQDACYPINPPSYTKLDNNGNVLDDSAAKWTMVKDNITGLIWEVKTDDNSLHDKDNTYKYDDALDVFIAQLNSENFGGYSNWRLPTIKELSYIIDFGRSNPSINPIFFPETKSDKYWTSTVRAYTDNPFISTFTWGWDFSEDKTNEYYVRAVRSEQTYIEPVCVLTDNGNNTVTDQTTGLMWQQETAEGQLSAGRMDWEEAIEYCETLTLGGYSDWRLPNIKELKSIVDFNEYYPAIDTDFFPDTLPFSYWSSTSQPSSTDQSLQIDFSEGGIRGGTKFLPDWYTGIKGAFVRAVRSGQFGSFDDLVISAAVSPHKGELPLKVDFIVTIYKGTPPYIYSWDFGDGIKSSNPNISHMFTEEGNYSVELTVTDADGNVATATEDISVAPPEYTITANNDNGSVILDPDKTSYTEGETVTLTAVPNAGYEFAGWSGDASGNSLSTSVTMKEDKAVTANFLPCQANTITLTGTSPNHTITSGSNEQVYGTSASNQIILESVAKVELINFSGQNNIHIQTNSEMFTVSRSGTVVTFQGSDGTALKIPATTDVQTISFNGGESRVLQIYNNQVMLDDQVITSILASIERSQEEPVSCGAYIAPGVWKEFDCYNLAAIGKNLGHDPFTPSWSLIGGYWQWGRKGPDSSVWHTANTSHFAHGPTGPGSAEANSGGISGWDQTNASDGAWSDSHKTANDPCPAGYRVPTRSQWDGVRNNDINPQRTAGARMWTSSDTNYTNARFFGDDLMLPAAGNRLNKGLLVTRGGNGSYWSSSENSSVSAWGLMLGSGNAKDYSYDRLGGASVRCIKE